MIKYPRNRSGHMPRKHRLAALFLLLGMFAVTVPATLAAIAPASRLLAIEPNTYIHSGSPANASSGIALDAQHMLVADDEDQQLRLYRRGRAAARQQANDRQRRHRRATTAREPAQHHGAPRLAAPAFRRPTHRMRLTRRRLGLGADSGFPP